MLCRPIVAPSDCEGAAEVTDEDVLHLGAEGVGKVTACKAGRAYAG